MDNRDYGIGAQILRNVGVKRMRLMTNNPAKYNGLDGYGLEIVERVALTPHVTSENVRYLRTKRDRLGHHLPDDLQQHDASSDRDGACPVVPSIRREAARFAPDDPQDLVDLAFGCPYCGGQSGIPQVASRPWEFSSVALCRCTSCEREWVLDLDLGQQRRLFRSVSA